MGIRSSVELFGREKRPRRVAPDTYLGAEVERVSRHPRNALKADRLSRLLPAARLELRLAQRENRELRLLYCRTPKVFGYHSVESQMTRSMLNTAELGRSVRSSAIPLCCEAQCMDI